PGETTFALLAQLAVSARGILRTRGRRHRTCRRDGHQESHRENRGAPRRIGHDFDPLRSPTRSQSLGNTSANGSVSFQSAIPSYGVSDAVRIAVRAPAPRATGII